METLATYVLFFIRLFKNVHSPLERCLFGLLWTEVAWIAWILTTGFLSPQDEVVAGISSKVGLWYCPLVNSVFLLASTTWQVAVRGLRERRYTWTWKGACEPFAGIKPPPKKIISVKIYSEPCILPGTRGPTMYMVDHRVIRPCLAI